MKSPLHRSHGLWLIASNSGDWWWPETGYGAG